MVTRLDLFRLNGRKMKTNLQKEIEAIETMGYRYKSEPDWTTRAYNIDSWALTTEQLLAARQSLGYTEPFHQQQRVDNRQENEIRQRVRQEEQRLYQQYTSAQYIVHSNRYYALDPSSAGLVRQDHIPDVAIFYDESAEND